MESVKLKGAFKESPHIDSNKLILHCMYVLLMLKCIRAWLQQKLIYNSQWNVPLLLCTNVGLHVHVHVHVHVPCHAFFKNRNKNGHLFDVQVLHMYFASSTLYCTHHCNVM